MHPEAVEESWPHWIDDITSSPLRNEKVDRLNQLYAIGKTARRTDAAIVSELVRQRASNSPVSTLGASATISLRSMLTPVETSLRTQFYDANELEQRFRNLATTWKNDTRFSSATTEIVLHPAYQQIIGLGRPALPLVFAELMKEPYHWYWALQCITGEDPSQAGEEGDLQKLRERWLQWGRSKGYVKNT